MRIPTGIAERVDLAIGSGRRRNFTIRRHAIDRPNSAEKALNDD